MTLLLGVCETVDSKFFATVWVIANYHQCIFERTLTTDWHILAMIYMLDRRISYL